MACPYGGSETVADISLLKDVADTMANLIPLAMCDNDACNSIGTNSEIAKEIEKDYEKSSVYKELSSKGYSLEKGFSLVPYMCTSGSLYKELLKQSTIDIYSKMGFALKTNDSVCRSVSGKDAFEIGAFAVFTDKNGNTVISKVYFIRFERSGSTIYARWKHCLPSLGQVTGFVIADNSDLMTKAQSSGALVFPYGKAVTLSTASGKPLLFPAVLTKPYNGVAKLEDYLLSKTAAATTKVKTASPASPSGTSVCINPASPIPSGLPFPSLYVPNATASLCLTKDVVAAASEQSRQEGGMDEGAKKAFAFFMLWLLMMSIALGSFIIIETTKN